MARTWTWASLCSACLLVGHAVPAAESIRPSEHLLPKTTKGYVAVADVRGLVDQWEKTQLGQLMSDPVMEPFAEDLRRQFEERFTGASERLGLTLEDLKDVAAGEVAVGSILTAPDETALAIVVDVTGNLPRAADLLKKISEVLIESGAKRSMIEVDESPDPVVQFEIPKLKDNPQAKARTAYYCLTGNLLAASDNLQVARGILARLRTDRDDSLADVAGFQAVMKRCAQDAGAIRPQIRWFVDPLGYGEVIRAAIPEANRRKGKPRVKTLRNQGFGAIDGVGGHIDLASQGYEVIHRTAMHAPPPYQKAMKMLSFPAGQDFTPQPWVPRDVATYATGYCDVLNAFDNFGPLFNELIGDEVWLETLASFKEDVLGPQIDLRADLAVRLGQRITVITDQQLPITPASERLLLAIAIKAGHEQDVAKAIEKFMSSEPNVVRRELEGRIVVWETVEEEQLIDVPKVSVDVIPSLTPLDDAEEEDWEEPEPLLPHAAITVTRGHLFIASHIDFLVKVLKVAKERETLGRSLDYRVVNNKLGQLGLGKQCFRSFTRTDEDYRATYELVRQGKMPLSESILGRLLNALLGERKQGVVRTPTVDGSKLPDFDVVRRYLGPAGMVVTTEPDGWFFKGFTLNKEVP